jgi:hypothetical protein
VILRLRRYRDRIEEITTGDGCGIGASAPAGVTAQRRLASLKNDLDHDSHECEIGRKRAVQSDCEQRFLWPALREAAGAMMEQPGTRLLDARAKEELRAAGFRIDDRVAEIPTAFTATFGAGKPVIGLIGEYDALPGLSQEALPRQVQRKNH